VSSAEGSSGDNGFVHGNREAPFIGEAGSGVNVEILEPAGHTRWWRREQLAGRNVQTQNLEPSDEQKQFCDLSVQKLFVRTVYVDEINGQQQ
jgi:hypothetical protein